MSLGVDDANTFWCVKVAPGVGDQCAVHKYIHRTRLAVSGWQNQAVFDQKRHVVPSGSCNEAGATGAYFGSNGPGSLIRPAVAQCGPPPVFTNSDMSISMTSTCRSRSAFAVFGLPAGNTTTPGSSTKVLQAEFADSSRETSINSILLRFRCEMNDGSRHSGSTTATQSDAMPNAMSR